jgi:protocadherin Fat 1/2/3
MPEWECVSQIEVAVTDVNDNRPVWGLKEFSAALKEDVPVGTVATKVHATDADEGDNRKIIYALLDSAGGFFKIDSASGIVTLAKPLDREVRAVYNLTVRAMDHGSPRLLSTARLVVLILDVNDNPPQFASKAYFASVREDVGTESDVVRVLATSRDSGVNADITYSLVAGNEHRKFSVDPKTGVILVAGSVDHERSSEYFLTIQAQDGGDPPLSNHASVNITVIDANDNPPVFSQVSYSALLSESARLGEPVISVTANDEDSGDNGRVTYSIVSGDRHGQFSVGQDGQIAVASPLDREMVSSYVLEVAAVDHGKPESLSATVLVSIDVSDANDNPPIFPEGNYTCYVQEDKPLGYVLQRFTVTDADDSPNGSPFTFDIRAGNKENSFRVVQDGTLRTAATFNRKAKSKYLLQVRVFDNGTPPLYSDSYVTVNIIEESRFPPVVVPLDVRILSYQDDFPGAVIASVKASDRDPYDRLSFELAPYVNLLSPPQSHLFEIDRNVGTVIALQGLDAGAYALNVSVSDGKFTTYSEARVVVEPVTDDMLDSAVIVRFGSVGPEDFLLSYQKSFVKAVRTTMNVESKDIVILGIQKQRRSKREALLVTERKKNAGGKKVTGRSEVLEVLLLVRKGKDSYFPRSKVRAALEEKSSKLSSQIGLALIEIQGDSCRSDSCDNGRCDDLVVMRQGDGVSVSSTDRSSFVSPRFSHSELCRCKEGFAGERCDVVLNECAREPCPSFKVIRLTHFGK